MNISPRRFGFLALAFLVVAPVKGMDNHIESADATPIASDIQQSALQTQKNEIEQQKRNLREQQNLLNDQILNFSKDQTAFITKELELSGEKQRLAQEQADLKAKQRVVAEQEAHVDTILKSIQKNKEELEKASYLDPVQQVPAVDFGSEHALEAAFLEDFLELDGDSLDPEYQILVSDCESSEAFATPAVHEGTNLCQLGNEFYSDETASDVTQMADEYMESLFNGCDQELPEGVFVEGFNNFDINSIVKNTGSFEPKDYFEGNADYRFADTNIAVVDNSTISTIKAFFANKASDVANLWNGMSTKQKGATVAGIAAVTGVSGYLIYKWFNKKDEKETKEEQASRISNALKTLSTKSENFKYKNRYEIPVWSALIGSGLTVAACEMLGKGFIKNNKVVGGLTLAALYAGAYAAHYYAKNNSEAYQNYCHKNRENNPRNFALMAAGVTALGYGAQPAYTMVASQIGSGLGAAAIEKGKALTTQVAETAMGKAQDAYNWTASWFSSKK